VLLEVRGLSAQAHGFALFSGIDVDLAGGELLCVDSEIELARSAFVGAVAGIETPSVRATGHVAVDGHESARDVVSVLQDAGFPQELPVATHLAAVLAGHAPDPAVAAAELLERVGLGHRGGHEPWAMSAGERRRIATALVLAAHAPLVLLDQPERGLDVASLRGLGDAIAAACDEGSVVVLATFSERLRRDCAQRGAVVVADLENV